jgi:hypothetical protein
LLRTDSATRARLRLADGSELTLDRNTALALLPGAARAAKLLQGNLVADVEKRPGEPAVIDVPHGRTEVIGTKLSLHADDASSWVNVSRGTVRLIDEQNRSVSLTAGEGGRLLPGQPPTAARLASLSDSFAWSERGFDTEDDAGDQGPRGLGELRAKKPGDDVEQTGSVRLTRHDVKVRIVDGMARTEVEEVFTNSTDDVLEGIYRFPLPPGAKIERLALEVDGRWEEGAFVDRERAAAIWRGAIVNSARKKPKVVDDIVWVPGPWKDPALLEWQRGGRFELRIFPIPKRGARRIRLAYTERLRPSGDLRRYTYPLPHDPSGSTRVGDFSFDVQVQGHTGAVRAQGYSLTPTATGLAGNASEGARTRLSLHEPDFVPTGDVVIEFDQPRSELRSWAYANSSTSEPAYVTLALRPELPRAMATDQRAVAIVVDRSRSMYGEPGNRAKKLAVRILREMDPRDRVTVLSCDSTCDEVPGGLAPAGETTARAAESFLGEQTAEGASDLVFALESASRRLHQAAAPEARVIYIGDGTPTVGPIQPGLIQSELRRRLVGNATVNAVTVGSASDDAALQAAANAGAGVVLHHSPGQTVAVAAYDVLAATYGEGLRGARLELPPGLTQVAPASLGTIAPGSEVLVVARFEGTRVTGPVVLRGSVGNEPFERTYDLELTASSHEGNAFVPRVFAATHIAELEQDPTAEAKARAIALSEKFNVASRHTSLLVLESPAMFKAFGLNNQRTAPLWTGEEGSIGSDATDSDDFESKDETRTRSDLRSTWDDGALPRDLGSSGSSSRGSRSASSTPGMRAPAPSAPAPKSIAKRRPASPCNCPPGDLLCAMRCEPEREFAPPPPERRRPPMVPMRRIWESQGKIIPWDSTRTDSSDGVRLGALEGNVRANPESRQALKDLYAGYVAAGNLTRAEELVERWSTKDPLDPDALTARADIAAERGNRDLAIRILGSVVDVRPSEHRAQWRLARLFRWALETGRSCAHDVAIAQLRSNHDASLADAVRCARAAGRTGLADDLLSAASPTVRAAALRLQTDMPKPGLNGEFRVEAEWEGAEADLDLALIHPDGYRVSWLGAPTRAVISAENVLSTRNEGLALRGVKSGRYAVEVVRGSGTGPVRGTLKVRFRDQHRSMPFVLEGDRVRLAEVNVTQHSRLVPL